MSNRAPSADAVRVRRASRPSTPSRASATAARPTRTATSTRPVNESATRAATPPTSAARASVTWSAGRAVAPARARARPSRPRVAASKARPTAQPAGSARPPGRARRARRGAPRPGSRRLRTVAPCLRMSGGIQRHTARRRPAFTRGGGRRQCRRTRGPSGSGRPAQGEIRAGRPARARPPTRSSCARCSRHQPGHRGARLPRRRARPASAQAMRAPYQEGDFPGPVKYGYLNVGVVESGPPELRGAPSSASTRTRPGTSCRPPR